MCCRALAHPCSIDDDDDAEEEEFEEYEASDAARDGGHRRQRHDNKRRQGSSGGGGGWALGLRNWVADATGGLLPWPQHAHSRRYAMLCYPMLCYADPVLVGDAWVCLE